MKSEKQSKLSLLLSKKPITECVTKPGSSLEYTKFWECSDDERNHTIELMQEYDYTEDDFAEAGIVLVNSIQNSICDFHLKFSDIIEDRMKQEEN